MTTTTYYRLRIYTGPVHTEYYAQVARDNGLTDVWTGTAHIYGTYAAPACADETDRQLLRLRAGQLIYPHAATAWRDVSILND